jgi:hypothetical protein
MNALVMEHVKVSELPELWRAKFAMDQDARVTVRIEEEAAATSDSAFGMWRNREDLLEVASHVRQLRAARFSPE